LPIYDVLVADELLPEFTNANPRTPAGFRILGPVDGPTERGTTRLRVQDDNAPDWTEGKLISPTFTATYETDERGASTGDVSRVAVTDWTARSERVR
jgi:hypothetical protein